MHQVQQQHGAAQGQAMSGSKHFLRNRRLICIRFKSQQRSELILLYFEVLVAVLLTIRVFWDVTRYRLINNSLFCSGVFCRIRSNSTSREYGSTETKALK